ncbi:MAG: hypothetical protein IJM79_08465 [Erysipelotrichaceae bacterium]|nr:hypothetical protein [Erysipelotrichaceae bacterium]
MKKTLRNALIMLTAALLVMTLAGCRKDVPAAGGWTDVDEENITAELQEIFNKAAETLTGVSYRPIRLVARQQTEGWNYKFLCEEITVTQQPTSREVYVTVYQDLNGNAEIIDIEDNGEGLEQIPNPFVGYQTLADAEKATGFKMSIPTEEDGYKILNISTMNDIMLQVDFEDGTMLRKQNGKDDISGDYNQYPVTEETVIDGAPVTLRISNNKVYSAIWQRDGYTYALFNEYGLSVQAARDIIAKTK